MYKEYISRFQEFRNWCNKNDCLWKHIYLSSVSNGWWMNVCKGKKASKKQTNKWWQICAYKWTNSIKVESHTLFMSNFDHLVISYLLPFLEKQRRYISSSTSRRMWKQGARDTRQIHLSANEFAGMWYASAISSQTGSLKAMQLT